MENASKALIIAGAILLSILLISLGIMIFSQAQDTVNNSGMSQAEVSSFNNKFLKYEGTRKGSEVKSLINEVISSNADENNSNNGATIKVSYNGNDLSKSGSSDIKNSNTYVVKLSKYNQGRVSEITITNVGSGS